LKHDCFAAIFVGGTVAGQSGEQTITLTELHEFFLATRPRVSDKPTQIGGGKRIH
jgi:hypothetical protein